MRMFCLTKNDPPRGTEEQLQPRQALGFSSHFPQWYKFQTNCFNVILKCLQIHYNGNHIKNKLLTEYGDFKIRELKSSFSV